MSKREDAKYSRLLRRRRSLKRCIDKVMPNKLAINLDSGVTLLIDVSHWKYDIAEAIARKWR